MTGKIFGNLQFCFIYLDDILVFSNSLASQQQHLCRVFDLCCLHGLIINLEKCTFATSQFEYLGLSSSGSTPLSKHVSAISSFPTPADCPGLQQFLGMVNFYWKFISGTDLLLRPVTDTLKGDPKAFSWSPEIASAFSAAKTALASVSALVHPDPSTKIFLRQLMPQTHMKERFFSSWFVAPGLPSPSSPRSCPPLSPGTLTSTLNS